MGLWNQRAKMEFLLLPYDAPCADSIYHFDVWWEVFLVWQHKTHSAQRQGKPGVAVACRCDGKLTDMAYGLA